MRLRKFLETNKGQAMVEMAIVIPILLILLMSIIEFGRIFNSYLILNQASREGARSAALGKNDTEITEIVNSSVLYLDSSNLTISISPGQSSRDSGANVTVKLQYDIDIVAPLIENIIPDPFHIETQTVMRVE